MSNDYKKFKEYLDRLRSIYFNALSAFYVYDAINDLKAPNVVGEKEVKENLRALNSYKNFFVTARNSLNFYFLMELAVLLDDSPRSLHLRKLINYVGSNKNKLNADVFEKNNKDRAFLQELLEGYEGIETEDLLRVQAKLSDSNDIIKKIIEYRNQYLAHEDLNKKEIHISREEVLKVFDLIADILNTLSHKIDRSIESCSHVEVECKKDTKELVDSLKKAERYRRKEIEKNGELN